MLWAYLSIPFLKNLYATQWIVMIALVVGITPLAARAAGGSIVQVGIELEEAARVAGASAARAVVGIVVRLILPSFVAAWFITSMLAAGNFDITVLLAAPSSQTVPLVAYGYYLNGSLARTAATLCLFIAMMIAVPVLALLVRAVVRSLPRGSTRFEPSQAAARQIPLEV